jgi:hypothetical protein
MTVRIVVITTQATGCWKRLQIHIGEISEMSGEMVGIGWEESSSSLSLFIKKWLNWLNQKPYVPTLVVIPDYTDEYAWILSLIRKYPRFLYAKTYDPKWDDICGFAEAEGRYMP